MNNSESILLEAKARLEEGRPQEALQLLGQILEVGQGESIFLKGEIYYKLQMWGDALNHFSHYKELFPDDKRSESYCLMIQNILGFYHKDLYNP